MGPLTQLLKKTRTKNKEVQKQGRRALTLVGNLKEDTDLEEIDEIRNVMMMRDVWKKIAKSVEESSTKRRKQYSNALLSK